MKDDRSCFTFYRHPFIVFFNFAEWVKDAYIVGRGSMKKKIWIGVAAFFGILVTVFNPPVAGIFALGAWIYLVVMIRKQKRASSEDQAIPAMPEPQLKQVKMLLTVAAVLFIVFVAGAILHNVRHTLDHPEELPYFLTAIIALWLFSAPAVPHRVQQVESESEAEFEHKIQMGTGTATKYSAIPYGGRRD